MVEKDKVIEFYKNLKAKVSEIVDPIEREAYINKELGKYSLEEWCEVGKILVDAKLM